MKLNCETPLRYGAMVSIPKELLTHQQIAYFKKRLTFQIEKYDGSIHTRVCYFDDIEYLRVPRQWALDDPTVKGIFDKAPHLSNDAVENPLPWPEFQGSYRPGQKEAVDKMVSLFKRGKQGLRLEGQCGSGKTIVSLVIASQIQQKTLVLVPQGHLAKQWADPFNSELFPGLKTARLSGQKWEDYADAHVVVMTFQMFYSRFTGDKLPEDFLEQFGLLIIDEGHRVAAETFLEALEHIPAKLRMAVSATWRRKDGLEDTWNWHIGEIGAVMKTKTLSCHYYQVPIQCKLSESKFQYAGNFNQAKFITAISEYGRLNEWLTENIVNAATSGRKTVICSQRVSQLEILHNQITKLLEEKGIDKTAGFFVGSLKGKQLKESQLNEASQCDIILATYSKMAEGVDIPKLDTIFLASPMSDVEQAVGRIRRIYDGKKQPLVVDPVLNTRYCQALAKKRRKIYESLNFTEKKVGA